MAILDRSATRVISASAASAALPGATPRELTASPSGRDRRRHPRLLLNELVWLESARIRQGPPVTIVDLSAGGALLETSEKLKPGSIQSLEISGPATEIVVLVDVLRCRPIDASESRFRAACRFPRPIDFPETPLRKAPSDNGERSAPNLLALSVDPPPAAERPAAPTSTSEAPKSDTAWQKLVVKLSDGTLFKGFSQDFNPTRGQFSLWPSLTAGKHERVQVVVDQLKAIFFVREFEGDPAYVKQKMYGSPSQGRRIEVTFNDGEVLLGSTLVYKPDASGFFVTPGDPKTNNTRVFVAAAAVRTVRFP